MLTSCWDASRMQIRVNLNTSTGSHMPFWRAYSATAMRISRISSDGRHVCVNDCVVLSIRFWLPVAALDVAEFIFASMYNSTSLKPVWSDFAAVPVIEHRQHRAAEN